MAAKPSNLLLKSANQQSLFSSRVFDVNKDAKDMYKGFISILIICQTFHFNQMMSNLLYFIHYIFVLNRFILYKATIVWSSGLCEPHVNSYCKLKKSVSSLDLELTRGSYGPLEQLILKFSRELKAQFPGEFKLQLVHLIQIVGSRGLCDPRVNSYCKLKKSVSSLHLELTRWSYGPLEQLILKCSRELKAQFPGEFKLQLVYLIQIVGSKGLCLWKLKSVRSSGQGGRTLAE